MEFLSAPATFLDSAIDAIPPQPRALAILALTVIAALVFFSIVVAVLRRFVKPYHPLFWSYLRRTHRPTRFAAVLLALSIGTQALPLPASAIGALTSIFQLGVIALIGWLGLIGAGMAADLYLLRFRLDAPDNLLARKHVTQVRVLGGALKTLIIIFTAAAALMTFESVRQYGVSLFASAGIAGIVVGFAARPLLSNLISGVQIAMTQPIRIDDAVVIENEWGWIEEITATYVVVKLWDWRRLVVPLSYFMEKPFQNWTRETASLIGTVFIYVDYTVPVDDVREAVYRCARASKLWDRNIVNVQVTDAKSDVLELRILVSGRNSPEVFDLRCEIREKIIAWLQREHPGALPRQREEQFQHHAPSLVPRESGAAEPAGTSARQ